MLLVFAGAGEALILLEPSTELRFKVYSNGISHLTNNSATTMSSMSRNNSTTSLMGFSVHQPASGAPLQFFPAMGSQQLDEMIDAYVPGNASILDKRTAVSLEFFEYSMATGDLFKFFMVYPALSSGNPSPMMESEYYSSFSTSPAMSESQWASSSRISSPSSSKRATSTSDFSNLPGMKIMTKDGRDVTNSASRGCKTKEQRDHAHLMRIIKACDSCRRKKTKCDPSHKRTSAGTSSGKVTKKTSRNPRPAAAPPQIDVSQIGARQTSTTPEFDSILSASSSSFDSLFAAESLNISIEDSSMDWVDQFIQYDQEPAERIPYDDFLFGQAGNFGDFGSLADFSPATASFSSSSTSPSQLPVTPVEQDVNLSENIPDGHGHKPLLPYLNPDVVEAGNDYVDFNLYSPQSSFSDEELGMANEVAASPIQSQRSERGHRRRPDARQEAAVMLEPSYDAVDESYTDSYRQEVIPDVAGDGMLHSIANHAHIWSSEGAEALGAADQGGVIRSQDHSLASDGQTPLGGSVRNANAASSPAIYDVYEGVTSEGLYGRETIYGPALSRALSRARVESTHVRSIAADGMSRLSRRLAEPQDGVVDCSGTAGATTRIESMSPQSRTSRSCGLCEPTIADGSATSSTSDRVHAARTTDTVMARSGATKDYASSTPVAVASENTVYRVSNAKAPSPALSQVIATIRPARLRASEPRQATLTTKKPTTASWTQTSAGRSPAEYERSQAVPWDSRVEAQYSTIATQGITSAATSTSSFGDMLPTASLLVGLGVLSVIVPFAAPATTTKLGNLDTCIQPVVLCKIAWSLVYLVVISALSTLGRLLPSICALGVTGHQILSSSSHKLPSANQLNVDSLENFRTASATALRMVRCDLSKKLQLWGGPQASSTAVSPRRKPAQVLARQTVGTLV